MEVGARTDRWRCEDGLGGGGAGPWVVAVDLGGTVELEGMEIEYAGEPWESVNVLGTEDLREWFDLVAITNRPVSCRALFFDFREDGFADFPAIQEIRWVEDPL